MNALEQLMGWVNQPVPQNNQSPLELLLSNPDAFTAAAERQKRAVVRPVIPQAFVQR